MQGEEEACIITDAKEAVMRIYLIRHAKQESKLCNDNTPLCEIGREQARLLGQRLKNYDIDAIYASNLIRAYETAKIAAKELTNSVGVSAFMEVKIREGLRETDFGELTYQLDSDIKVKYKEFMESRYYAEEDWAYPGGESGKTVYERAKKVLDEIIQSGYKNVAVVTHGGTIRVLLAGLFQGSQKNRLLLGKCMERGGFCELFYEEETRRFYLERFNDYAHLEGRPECMMRKGN